MASTNFSLRSTVELVLTQLQESIRRTRPVTEADHMTTRRLPIELTGGQATYLMLTSGDRELLRKAEDVFMEDLRFEHLQNADGHLWTFASRAWLTQNESHVLSFVREFARDPFDAVCCLPVEYLAVAEPVEFMDVRLVPAESFEFPGDLPMVLESVPGCICTVSVRGTSYERMAMRARSAAEHALRVLHVQLRDYPAMQGEKLRFYLGDHYAIDNVWGWFGLRGIPRNATLTAAALSQVDGVSMGAVLSSLPVVPSCDIERKAVVALRWLERALLENDALIALLFLFNALESMLGDKSEGSKAFGLAFRQALLSHSVTSEFANPSRTWFLYDQIRSAAVHGSDTPPIDWETVNRFSRTVRETLVQYVWLAQKEGFKRRARLLRWIDSHADRDELADWLMQHGGELWVNYFQRKGHSSECDLQGE